MIGKKGTVQHPPPALPMANGDSTPHTEVAKTVVICDFVLLENLCNLNCRYCRPGWPKLILKNDELYCRDRATGTPVFWKKMPALKNDWLTLLDQVVAQLQPPVVKVSGGEIFLIPGIYELLGKMAAKTRILQILTNGAVYSPVDLAFFRQYGNIHFQLSIDGHRLDMSSLRLASQKLLDRILGFLSFACAAGHTVEINCVLSCVNIDRFFEFVAYVRAEAPYALIVPFPVRGAGEFYPTGEQVRRFESNYFALKDPQRCLPPIAYMQKLIQFLSRRERPLKCYTPLFVYSLYGDGVVQYCTCGSDYPSGNLGHQTCAETIRRSGELFRDQVRDTKILAACADCYTHYDVINCFLAGLIELEELDTFSIFRDSLVRDRLLDLRRQITETGM